jgi:hypothetical protein
MPSRWGPCHWGQSSAQTAPKHRTRLAIIVSHARDFTIDRGHPLIPWISIHPARLIRKLGKIKDRCGNKGDERHFSGAKEESTDKLICLV